VGILPRRLGGQGGRRRAREAHDAPLIAGKGIP
jgi:hypothetical protein